MNETRVIREALTFDDVLLTDDQLVDLVAQPVEGLTEPVHLRADFLGGIAHASVFFSNSW